MAVSKRILIKYIYKKAKSILWMMKLGCQLKCVIPSFFPFLCEKWDSITFFSEFFVAVSTSPYVTITQNRTVCAFYELNSVLYTSVYLKAIPILRYYLKVYITTSGRGSRYGWINIHTTGSGGRHNLRRVDLRNGQCALSISLNVVKLLRRDTKAEMPTWEMSLWGQKYVIIVSF